MENLIVFLIVVIVWIVRAVSEKGGEQQNQDREKQKNRLQDEIERFKREVGNERQEEQKEWREKKRKRERPQIEKKRPRRRKPSEERSQNQNLPSQKKKKRESLGKRKPLGSEERLASRHLGEGVSAHAQQHISSHASALGTRSSQNVSGHVREHLQPFETHIRHTDTALDPSPDAPLLDGQKIIAIMRDPTAIRQAIIVNEILQKPMGQRK